jgi:hypothetical protein
MVSSDGSGNPSTGNGQLLYAKEFRIYSTTPSLDHGGSTNVFGNQVGIGTTSPTSKLTTYYTGIYDSNTTRFVDITGEFFGTNPSSATNAGAFTGIRMGNITAGKYAMMGAVSEDNLGFSRANGLSFWTSPQDTAPIERLRISNAGNVGIGTTSPVEKVYVSDGLNEFGINPTTLASPFNAVNGTSLDFRFTANGNTNARFAAIVGALDAGSAGNNSGHLEFWTAPTGSGNPAIAERMRIDSSGNVLMGNTVVNPASGFSDQRGFGYANSTGQVQIATTANAAAMEIGKNNANDGNIIVFRKQATTVGNISITGSATTYNSGSDYRLKDITGPVINSGTFIDALKPKVGSWKSDGSKFVGFLAHEFAEVSPSSVSGEKDAVDSDGKPIYQAMQASSSEVIANLVAELQSLRARVAALENN